MVLTGWKLSERKWTNTTERLIEDLELECTQYVFDLNTSWRKFSKVSSRRYVDGHVDIFDMVDIDLFSVIVLNMMVLQLGYTCEFEPMYYDYLRLLSTLDEGLYALACSGIDSYGLSRDESFRVDKLDLNVNLTVDLNVSQAETQAEIEEHIIEHVIVEEVVDGSSEEDVEQGNGQEAVKAHSDEQVDYDVEGIDNAYETQYHVESSEDVRTDNDDDDDDDDDDFLVDEENEIVEPDVDVHLFGTRKDVPCDNIGVTNLVPNDVLEIEGSTLFWRFVRIIHCASGLSFLTAVPIPAHQCLIGLILSHGNNEFDYTVREKIMESTFFNLLTKVHSRWDDAEMSCMVNLNISGNTRVKTFMTTTSADQCDAFDSNVDEAPTAQTMFMANLSFVAPVYDKVGPSYDLDTLSEVQNHDNYLDDMKESHEEHEIQNDVQPNDVVDSDTEYTSSCNLISYEQVAIGYKNPFYLSKAKEVQPALCSGQDIVKPNHTRVLVHDADDTLEIAETTRRQMIEKMKNLEYLKKKVKIAPHDYSKENYLATFIPHKQLTPEQILWSDDLFKMKAKALKENAKSAKPITAMTVYPPNTPAKLVLKVLPTKTLIKEIKEVFDQMEDEVDQHAIDKKCDEIERKNILLENKNLIAECMSNDVFYTATNFVLTVSRFSDMHDAHTAAKKRIAELEAENSSLKTKIQNDDHDKMIKHFSKLETTSLLDEIENLKAQLKEKMKCVTLPAKKPKVLAPGMYAIDVEPIPSRNRNNREVHLDYLKHIKESVATLREIAEEARVETPLDSSFASACRYTKHSRELLEYVIGTCPKDFNARDKKLASTPFTKKKQVTFKEPCETSTHNTPTHPEQQNLKKTNEHVIPSTGVKCATSASESKHRSNTKKDRT
nr:hypothetical protein [Tanacetum cinerariifolium]